MKVFGGDDIVLALEAQLRKNVPLVLEALGLTDELGGIETWQIVPSADAIAAARLPAVAIVSPTMNAQPTRAGNGEYTGVWQVSAGIFARGTDHEHTQTQVQKWVKVLRAAALLTPLSGTGFRLRWVGEEYDLIPTKENARTIAGGEVMFDASVDTALDLTDIVRDPLLRSVHPTVNPTQGDPLCVHR